MPFKIEVGMKVTKDEVADFKKALERIVQDEVLVGVPEQKAGRKEGKINNAALAYVHNTGSPVRNIPARPFMEPGIMDVKNQIELRMRQVAEYALKGSATAVEKALNAIGLLVSSSIKRKIDAGIPPPLSAGTLAGRRRKGMTRTKPLVVTGQLRNSISYTLSKIKRKFRA